MSSSMIIITIILAIVIFLGGFAFGIIVSLNEDIAFPVKQNTEYDYPSYENFESDDYYIEDATYDEDLDIYENTEENENLVVKKIYEDVQI